MHRPRREPLQRSPGIEDLGITVFHRRDVEAIEYSFEAAGLVASAVNEFNNRRKHQDVELFELMLSEGVNPSDAVSWMGKTLVRDYGSDFASVDMFSASASNRAADHVPEKLEELHKNGNFGFMFIIERADLTELQFERAERLRGKLGSLNLPAMRLVPAHPLETYEVGEGGQETGSVSSIVAEQDFTLDTQLGHPIVLRPRDPSS